MREALIQFLDALESIGVDHEEVYDTDIRECSGVCFGGFHSFGSKRRSPLSRSPG